MTQLATPRALSNLDGKANGVQAQDGDLGWKPHMDLSRSLYGAGYSRIALSSSNGASYVYAAATVEARPVAGLIDTAASHTILSLTIARELDLPLTVSGLPAAGAGSATMQV